MRALGWRGWRLREVTKGTEKYEHGGTGDNEGERRKDAPCVLFFFFFFFFKKKKKKKFFRSASFSVPSVLNLLRALRHLVSPAHTPTNKDNAKRALSSIHWARSTKPASSPIRSNPIRLGTQTSSRSRYARRGRNGTSTPAPHRSAQFAPPGSPGASRCAAVERPTAAR